LKVLLRAAVKSVELRQIGVKVIQSVCSAERSFSMQIVAF